MAKNLDRFLFDGRKISFLDEFILLLTLAFFKMMSLIIDDRAKRKIDFSEPFSLTLLTNNTYFRYKNILRNLRVISVPDFQ